MKKSRLNWLSKPYPQNYIIRKPLVGALLAFVFSFGFILLYRPLHPNDLKIFGYEGAMALYCFLASLTLFGAITALKLIPFFSDPVKWTPLKELLLVVIALLLMSVVIFAAGFFVETTGSPRYWDSFQATFLIGIIPFIVFSLRNLSYFFPENKEFATNQPGVEIEIPLPEKINIVSRLKNENLSFYPDQFLFAESESNYVTFHLLSDNKLKKITIRNAIADIENQLSGFPYFYRTHRAFIVNLKKVVRKSGNSLGYRLRLAGVENELPVSRQKTQRVTILLSELFPE